MAPSKRSAKHVEDDFIVDDDGDAPVAKKSRVTKEAKGKSKSKSKVTSSTQAANADKQRDKEGDPFWEVRFTNSLPPLS